MSKFIDLTGERFGRLTVIKRADDYISPKGQKKTQWKCICDCGNTIVTTRSQLKNGITKSCGCLQKDRAKEANKLTNKYDLSGEYGVGYTSNGDEFYFDIEDYDKIKDYCWFKSGVYIATHMYKNNKRKFILMHRFIMNCDDPELIVDHKHGEGTTNDNRKSNLRIGTIKQNEMNRKQMNNNTSGATGVHWDKHKNKWMAYIGLNNKHIHLGYYDNFDDAVAARKKAEEEYFGEWSYNNSQTS